MNTYDKLNPNITYFMYSSKKSKWSTHETIDFYSMVFILDGKVTYFINNQEYEVKQGEVVFIRPANERKAYTSNMHYVAIDFTLEHHVELPFAAVTKISRMNSYLPYFSEINTEWLQQGFGYRLKCKGLLLIILQKLLTEKINKQSNKNVEQIKSYIIQNYPLQITLSVIAEQLNISPVYCGALFKKYEKCSIPYYINRMRINQSIILMQKTNLNISEIAFQTGFNDIYYFSKTFKKITGMTPSNFRKNSYELKNMQ